jgi:hypothetical protein
MDIKPPQNQYQNNQMPQPGYQPPNQFNRQQQVQIPPAPQVSPASNMKHANKFIFGYIGLIVLAVAVAGVYYWQPGLVTKAKSTIASQQSQISDLNNQLSTANKNLASLKSAASTVTSNPSSTTTTFKLTDIGITLNNLPSTLTGLSQNYTAATTSSVLSTASLTSADANCGPTKGPGIGLISKATGTYDSKTSTLKTNETFVKQFTGFYVTYTKPSASCSTVAATNSIQTTQAGLLQTLLNTPANVTAP